MTFPEVIAGLIKVLLGVSVFAAAPVFWTVE
jgi:hypothetical protein